MSKKRTVVLCYRKIISASTQNTWEKYVFDSSYAEYRMQVQYYDREKKYSDFAALLRNVPAAEKLHFLVSASVTGYIQQLGNKLPDIADNLGQSVLYFDQYRFELINSSVSNKELHKVAIHFFTQPMIWHDTPGQYLLLSPAKETNSGEMEEWSTMLVPLQSYLSIYSLKESI
jgi:hypothetical protein